MSKLSYRTSRPNSWAVPRPPLDPSIRLSRFGKIQPMEEPGLLSRLFRKR